MAEKITIIDVALKAGVSKGTVDRVIYNRGEVSAKSAEKVRKAIEELDYHPNVHASLLASKRPKVIACLMPEFRHGEFWEKVHVGFMRGCSIVRVNNVLPKEFLYDQYSMEDFNRVAEDLLKSHPDGVVMPTLFQEATFELSKKLSESGIPYVYVDTKAEDDGGYLAFFGMPRHESGELVAALLTERVSKDKIDDVLIVRIKRDTEGMSDPTARRREGFVEFMNRHYPDASIHNLLINPSDIPPVRKVLADYLSEHRNIKYVVMFNSRIHLLAESLADFPLEGRRVIGFDDLPQNLEMLRNGLADIIIAQHVEDQCARGVALLANYILSKVLPEVRDNYAHIDIITKYNIENF